NSGLHMTAYERNVNYNLYGFILSKDTTSIFKTESDEVEVVAGKKEVSKKAEERLNDKNKGKSTDKKSDKSYPPCDLDEIMRRLVALPLPSGRYLLNGSTENKLTYMRGNTIGIYDLKKLEDKTLVEHASGFDISANGKKMIYRGNRDFFI